ncbi:MAG: LacI family DNA-binding transcriptional regulator [Bacteroidales bacterium]
MTVKKEVTIYDIAEKLHISASTVSRGLRNHPAIRKETIRRIKEAAESMGYQQKTFASNLRKNRSNTIGVILPRLDSNFQSSVVAGIEKKVNQYGYNLIISQSRESKEKEDANIDTMYNSRVDGLLASLACDTCDLGHFNNMLRKGIPVVLFDRVKDHPDYSCSRVIIDNVKAGMDATMHLVEEGCHRIMYVGDNLISSVYAERHQGYQKALTESHLPFEPDLTFVTTLDEDSGERVLARIRELGDPPDGIFAANDTSAVSVIYALKQAGFSVPEHVAVVGFNDVHIARVIDPPLTTIRYPGEEMGEVAAATLIEQLHSTGPVVTKTVVLDHQLIIRKSSLRKVKQLLTPS